MNKISEKIKKILTTNKNLSSVASAHKGLLLIGSSGIIGSAISAAFWLLVASLLSVEEYGEISYFIAIASLGICCIVGSPQTLTVYSTKHPKIIPTLLLLTLIFAGIGSLIAFLIVQRFEIITLIFSFIVLEASLTLLLGKKLYSKYSKFLLTQKILQFVIGISLSFSLGLNGILIGIVLANFSLIPIFYKELRNYKIDFSLLKPKKEFIINNEVIYLISVFRRDIDKIIIVPILGFTVLGNFALTLQFFAIMMIISSISFEYLLPKDVGGEKNANLKKFLILVSVLIALSGFFFSPYFIENFFTKFSESIIPIQIASFCVIPSTISMILFSKILALEKSRFLIIANLVQLCAILIGTIYLGILYSIIGVTVAFILGNTIYAITLAIINYKYVGKKKFDI
jgi:O-antigen/teichoic acid export membrane protein